MDKNAFVKYFVIPGVLIFLLALFVMANIFAPPGKGNIFSPPQSSEPPWAKPPIAAPKVTPKYVGEEYNQVEVDLRNFPQTYWAGNGVANPQTSDKIITASPVDPTQIERIYKFRSCHGHDYYGVDYDGNAEPNSSMKNYFKPLESLENTNNKVKIFAPFNGVIVQIDPMDIIRGRHFMIMHEPFDGWYATFIHINFQDSQIYEGAHVKAGQLLGYAVTDNYGRDFDFALQRFKYENAQYNGAYVNDNFQTYLTQNLEPPFAHMTNAVLAKWAAKGVTASDTIVSKEYREANPCTCKGGPPGTTSCHYHNLNGMDSVVVKQ